jgi:hypothetical protein
MFGPLQPTECAVDAQGQGVGELVTHFAMTRFQALMVEMHPCAAVNGWGVQSFPILWLAKRRSGRPGARTAKPAAHLSKTTA